MIIKATFKNPIDGEYDTINTKFIDKIAFNDTILEGFDSESRTIKYSLSFSEDEPDIVTISGIINGVNSSTTLDIQEFANEMSRCVHANKLADSCDFVINAKSLIISEFRDLLIAEQFLCLDVPYESFGYIYSSGDKIGTFEGVKLSKDNEIELIQSMTVLDLANTNDISIEFVLAGKMYSTDLVYKVGNTSVLKIEDSEAYNVPNKDMYESEEDLYAARRSLISIVLVSDNTSIDEFSDLF